MSLEQKIKNTLLSILITEGLGYCLIRFMLVDLASLRAVVSKLFESATM